MSVDEWDDNIRSKTITLELIYCGRAVLYTGFLKRVLICFQCEMVSKLCFHTNKLH